jgi:hypothetical protein
VINQSQPTRQSKLFLSHGASTREMQDIVERVASGLEEKGFDVFEYRDSSVEAGQHWRYCLLVALLLCDSAAVLLDDRAPTRRWVRYEMEILKVRRILEPEFALMTIEIKPTTDTALVVENLSRSLARAGALPWAGGLATPTPTPARSLGSQQRTAAQLLPLQQGAVERQPAEHLAQPLPPRTVATLVRGRKARRSRILQRASVTEGRATARVVSP